MIFLVRWAVLRSETPMAARENHLDMRGSSLNVTARAVVASSEVLLDGCLHILAAQRPESAIVSETTPRG